MAKMKDSKLVVAVPDIAEGVEPGANSVKLAAKLEESPLPVEATEELEAAAIVEAVEMIAQSIRRTRKRIELEGGSATKDATSFAGYLAKAIRARGGRLPDANANKLRWPIAETPRPLSDPTGLDAARELVAQIVACLKRAPGDDQVLDDAAAVWPKHRTKGEAEAELAEIAGKRAKAEAERAAAAHHARLGQVHDADKRHARAVQNPKPSRQPTDDERIFETKELGGVA